MLLAKNSIQFYFISVVIIVISSLSIISCSKTPDVRLTMCQDLVVLFLNSPDNIEWQKHEPIFRGYKDLEMPVSYSDDQTVNKSNQID